LKNWAGRLAFRRCAGFDVDGHCREEMVIACAMLFAVTRLQPALFRNEHCRFTTWRWGRVLAVLPSLGLMTKPVLTA
jgi:hypothetical protein